MKSIKTIYNLCFALAAALLISSCDDITEINEDNPNGVSPTVVHPNLLLSTAMSQAGKHIVGQGYGNQLAAYVQHTQKDSWSDNLYDWDGTGWGTYYSVLRNANRAYNRAVELDLEFHQGVAMVMKAHMFGMLTDFYGDVPYSEALKGGDAEEILKPIYDSQESVYKGIIADLLTASALLSKDAGAYSDIQGDQDLYFNGDPDKWMRFANSLALRYYMRLSEKDASFAQSGVQAMLGQPLISSVDEECALPFIGVTGDNSWPSNGVNTTRSDFTRIKPCATFTYKLAELDDPRMNIWFAPIETPIKVVPVGDIPGGGDDVLDNGIRYINEATLAANNQKIYDPATWYQDRVDGLTMIDTNSVYVGLPVANQDTDPYTYNLNPKAERGGWNTHVSEMNSQFMATSGDNLKARIFSYAELCFLKAEAAVRGWGSDAETHYNEGIQASLDSWGIGDEYGDYIDNTGVAFDGSLDMVLEQKWISNFTSAMEAYLDWRRTGLPDLQTGPFAKSTVIPVRFVYDDSDKDVNNDNYNAALGGLQATDHTDDVPGYQGNDSPWSKPWILQGVTKPW